MKANLKDVGKRIPVLMERLPATMPVYPFFLNQFQLTFYHLRAVEQFILQRIFTYKQVRDLNTFVIPEFCFYYCKAIQRISICIWMIKYHAKNVFLIILFRMLLVSEIKHVITFRHNEYLIFCIPPIITKNQQIKAAAKK